MAIVEILPPKQSAEGLTYQAAVYTNTGDHVLVSATVSEGLRRRMAVNASRAMAWAKQHIRIPAGPLMDLMGGNAPDCGCDAVGEAFRAACLETADLAEEAAAVGAELHGCELVWSFDDWDGSEASFLPDVATMAGDTFGATMSRTALPVRASAARSGIQRATLAAPGTARRPVGQVTPGLAALQAALAAILGH